MKTRANHDPVLPLARLKELRGGALTFFWKDRSALVIPPPTPYPDPPSDEDTEQAEEEQRRQLGAALAIDFGTSTIAAAVAGFGDTQVLWFREPGTGRLTRLLDAPVGRRNDLGRATLEENYSLEPVGGLAGRGWSYYPCLKRRIELLARASANNEWMPQAALDVAGVCLRALSTAQNGDGIPLKQLLGDGSRVYVSVPNTFPEGGVEVIRTGVGYAVAALLPTTRVPEVFTLLEAEAVAYGKLLAPQLSGSDQPLDPVLVIDAGAGTTDASILRKVDRKLQVVAHAGLPVGGIDLDAFIASLEGPLRELEPEALAQGLRRAREQKHKHWQQADAGGLPPAEQTQRAMEALAREMTDPRTPEFETMVAKRAESLAQAHRRYLALAAHALVRSLPRQELAQVRSVILSGRSSLVLDFRRSVQEALEEQGCGKLEPLSEKDEDRKLAVVKGVGAFHQAGVSDAERRPLRAIFPVVLNRPEPGPDKDEILMKAGHPLLEGWGVVAWHQAADGNDGDVEYTIRSRLVGDEVIRDLVAKKRLRPEKESEEAANVLKWSRMFLTRFPMKAPFSARLAYDFLSRRVTLEVDGAPVRLPVLPVDDAGGLLLGRFHPIHELQENWFETHHKERG